MLSDEQAKAGQELAKTGGQALDLAKRLGGFFNRVFGETAAELGGIGYDWAKYFRYKNAAAIADKVDAIHAKRKLEGKTVPISPKYGIPIIEKAGMEDDPILQDLWAGLIANALDPGKRLNLKKIYAEVLSSLEALDVAILRYLAGQGWKLHQWVPGGGIDVLRLVTATTAPEGDVKVSLQNLHRLGLLVDDFVAEFHRDPFKDPLGKTTAGLSSSSFGARLGYEGTTFRPSPLGDQLLKACES